MLRTVASPEAFVFSEIRKLVLPGGYAFHKFSIQFTTFHNYSQLFTTLFFFVGEAFKCRHLHFRNPSGQWWGQFAEMDKFSSFPHSTQVHRYTGTQVHRYTGTQVHRYTGTQVHRYTGTQVHRYTGAQVHRYTGTQVHRYTGTQVHRYTGTQVHRYTGTQVHRYTGTQVHHITFYLVNPSIPLNGWATTQPKKNPPQKKKINSQLFTTFHNYSHFSQLFTIFHQPSQFYSGFRVVKICEMHTPREAP